ncbi:hypothetical protein [Nocardia abscessus]|uniref:hypothetical protein n=1 Tax=Nocardia abscessus TaxID=120957 RepID=UPI0024562F9F|nr:hypothetical protein [Nocardia abscessus]
MAGAGCGVPGDHWPFGDVCSGVAYPGAPGDTARGAGGAIVLDSDPAEEYHEVLLKAAATLRAAADHARR